MHCMVVRTTLINSLSRSGCFSLSELIACRDTRLVALDNLTMITVDFKETGADFLASMKVICFSLQELGVRFCGSTITKNMATLLKAIGSFINEPTFVAAYQQLTNGWPRFANQITPFMRVAQEAKKHKNEVLHVFVFYLESLVSYLRNEHVTEDLLSVIFLVGAAAQKGFFQMIAKKLEVYKWLLPQLSHLSGTDAVSPDAHNELESLVYPVLGSPKTEFVMGIILCARPGEVYSTIVFVVNVQCSRVVCSVWKLMLSLRLSFLSKYC